MRYDINKVVITGRIEKIELITTKTLRKAVNLLIATENKYMDIVQAQAYGLLAESIEQTLSEGADIILIGRLRSIQSNNLDKATNWIIIEKIGTELIPRYDDDRGNQNTERV